MAGLSLPRGSRIRHAREVRRGFDRGRSAAAGPVVVYAFDRLDGEPPRYALVVGKRWGDAVARNRVRRLLREAFRTARPRLRAGFDFVLLPRDALGGLRMQEVRRLLESAARRAAERFQAEGPREDAPPRDRRGRR